MKKIAFLTGLIALSCNAHAAEQKFSTQNTQRVLPEISTQVVLSNSSVNRIVCESGEAVPAVFSKEKPVDVVVGKDKRTFWVKFKYLADGSVNHYFSEPTELFLTCGTSTFELIALPKFESPHKILLGSDTKDRIKDNQALFSALSLEEAAVQLSTKMITDGANGKSLPESFEVVNRPSAWSSDVYDKRGRYVPIEIRQERDVLVDGTGLKGTQFTIRAKSSVQLDETMFLNTKYGANIFAITLEKLSLSSGQLTSLIIVYRESK